MSHFKGTTQSFNLLHTKQHPSTTALYLSVPLVVWINIEVVARNDTETRQYKLHNNHQQQYSHTQTHRHNHTDRQTDRQQLELDACQQQSTSAEHKHTQETAED